MRPCTSGQVVAAAGDAQWQQRVAGRLQQLRCVAKAVATFGGRQPVSAGEADENPLILAMGATKKHLDAIETDLVRTEDDLARTRHKLQVGYCQWHCRIDSACDMLGSLLLLGAPCMRIC